MHMGAMHPFEQLLTLLLAVGPFVVLGVVVLVRRRADEREAAQAALSAQAAQAAQTPSAPASGATPAEGQGER